MYSNGYMYLKGYCVGRQLHNSVKALGFMHNCHKGQLRNDGVPYFEHPVKVANYLIQLDLIKNIEDLDILISTSLMHDVIEDQAATYLDIEKEFGKRIARNVQLLSKTKETNMDEYFKNIQDDLLLSLTKCSDRIHNVSTMLGTFQPERLERYIEETKKYILPLIYGLREGRPEISEKICVISYHMESILHCANEYLKLVKTN